ncbi:MAG: hypothetical protein RRY02_09745 [Muribaculaceae bacterium]
MQTNFYGSICLSDIPKRLIKKADNGKLYLNINVFERREVGMYGDTHTIVASCKKDDQLNDEKLFIGDLKPSTLKAITPEVVEKAPIATEKEVEDLPF